MIYTLKLTKSEMECIKEALEYTSKVNRIELNKYDKGKDTKIPNDKVKESLERWANTMDEVNKDIEEELRG